MAELPCPEHQLEQADCATVYNAKVIQAHEKLRFYKFLAAAANWLFLAGFIVFPGTFASISKASLLSESEAGRAVQHAIRNIPLLVIGCLCCFFGATAIGRLSWKIKNEVWLVDQIFLPGLLNSIVALLMSLLNVYTAQDGNWSVTAIVTICIIGAWCAVMGSMFAIYEFYILAKLRMRA